MFLTIFYEFLLDKYNVLLKIILDILFEMSKFEKLYPIIIKESNEIAAAQNIFSRYLKQLNISSYSSYLEFFSLPNKNGMRSFAFQCTHVNEVICFSVYTCQ